MYSTFATWSLYDLFIRASLLSTIDLFWTNFQPHVWKQTHLVLIFKKWEETHHRTVCDQYNSSHRSHPMENILPCSGLDHHMYKKFGVLVSPCGLHPKGDLIMYDNFKKKTFTKLRVHSPSSHMNPYSNNNLWTKFT
jgi:hypothetical protein